MKYLYSRRSNSLADERGFYLVFLAGSILALLAVMGLAVDVGMLEAAKLRLQRAVDASSIAATYLLEDKTRDEIIPLARQLVLDNLYQTGFDPSEVVGQPQVILEPATGTPRVVRVSAVVRPPLKILRLIPWIKSRPTVSAEAQSNNVRVAVALVLDRSGSMTEVTPCDTGTCLKIDELKKAAIKFVDEFGSEDRLAVVSFSNSATVDYAMTKNPNKVALHAAINAITASGNTNTYDGIVKGRQQINSAVNSDLMSFDFKSIVVVTDGAPWGYPSPVPSGVLPPGCTVTDVRKQRYLLPLIESDKARSQGITLYAVGLGMAGEPVPSASCVSGTATLQYTQNDPYQCAYNYLAFVKNYFLARLVNDQEVMAGDPGATPPLPMHPDFTGGCVPGKSTIASNLRGKYFQTANPSDLDNLLLSIGRSIKARLTK